MPTPANPEELALVRLAISHIHITGCFEWEEKEYSRARANPPVPNFTAKGIKRLVNNFVMSGGEIIQVREEREPWRDLREYWYKVIVPHENLRRGLFVEMVLDVADRDYPVVHIVNVHPQR